MKMKTVKRFRSSIRRQMWYVALGTATILLLPLVAMQITEEVNWNLSDFLVMGFLLLGTGFSFVFISKLSESIAYRSAVALAMIGGFLLIWLNLAVGIIGSENHPANLLYGTVLLTGFIGAAIAHLKPHGMSITLFLTAFVQFLIPLFARFFMWHNPGDQPDITAVFVLNTLFVLLFMVSGLLFRFSRQYQHVI